MLTSYEFASAWLQARCKTDRGASLVEYALLVALIAVVCILAVTFLGQKASSKLPSAGSAVTQPLGFRAGRGGPSGPPRSRSGHDGRKGLAMGSTSSSGP